MVPAGTQSLTASELGEHQTYRTWSYVSYELRQLQTHNYRFITLPVTLLERCDWLLCDQDSIHVRPPRLKHLQEAERVDDFRTFRKIEKGKYLHDQITVSPYLPHYLTGHQTI